MFKQCLLALVLAGLVYSVTPAAVAQDGGNSDQSAAPAGAPPERGHGHGQFDPARRAEMLGKRLNLNADQQAKVQDILKSEQSQMQGVHQDASLSEQDRRSKMMDIQKTSNDQIRGVLKPDQQKKWDEVQAEQQQRMQGHRPGGEAPGTPPDSAEPK